MSPVIKSTTASENRIEMALSFPADAIYFQGHFPEKAVLPGFVQVHYAITTAKKYWPDEQILGNVKKLRFTKIIAPDLELKLIITKDRHNKISFEYRDENSSYSSGEFHFKAAEAIDFRPCILIPVYNHGVLLEKNIGKILAYNLPTILVNDGSDSETTAILARLQHENPQITLLNLTQNQGKGAALKQGFSAALAQGFTHALQIDADGQHEISDIPLFLKLGKENPQSLINGCPIYDASVPKSRLYGRKITNFFVALETFSRNISDAMCGFRLYPLAKTVKILSEHKTSARMGFDIEIVVLAALEKIKIINQPTHVIYPADGSSNFHAWRDNFQISLVHTRLCLIALKKLLTPSKHDQ